MSGITGNVQALAVKISNSQILDNIKIDMKILVTGAKGFVGKNLCAQLNNIKDMTLITR